VWGEFLDRYDLFLCPTTPTTAPPLGSADQNDPAFDTAESWIEAVFDRLPFTPIFNSTGQPSISLPLATDDDGTPIGVMLSAQALREDVLLQVASQLEEALPWADRRPAVISDSS
jgi:amidase